MTSEVGFYILLRIGDLGEDLVVVCLNFSHRLPFWGGCLHYVGGIDVIQYFIYVSFFRVHGWW